MRELSCLRCGAQMQYMMRERLQLGKTGWILGDLPNLSQGRWMRTSTSARTAASWNSFSQRMRPDRTKRQKRPALTAARR